MSLADAMRVRLLLPTRLLYEGDVRRVSAHAENGAFGLLPNHADHVASLVPSVLVLENTNGEELFFGIDHGLLIKQGHQVDVALQRGVQGSSLETLSQTVESSFMEFDEEERVARTALARLEIGILRNFGKLKKSSP